MAGTLELLCGPSGVGKTSHEAKKNRAYTYTTRPMREDEHDGTDRRFVTEDEFERLVQQRLILAPYDCLGHRYGFAADLREKLSRGETVSEQIVPYEAIDGVVDAFQGSGLVKKHLFLAFPQEIERRIIVRSDGHPDERRILAIRDSLKKGMERLFDFDEVTFNCIILDFYASEFVLLDNFFSAMLRESYESLLSGTKIRIGNYKDELDYAVECPHNFHDRGIPNPYLPILARPSFKRLYRSVVCAANRRNALDALNLVMERTADYAQFRDGMPKSSQDLMDIVEPYPKYQHLQFILNQVMYFSHSRGIDPQECTPYFLPLFLRTLACEIGMPLDYVLSINEKVVGQLSLKSGFYYKAMRRCRNVLPEEVLHHFKEDIKEAEKRQTVMGFENRLVSGLEDMPAHGKSVYVIPGVNRSTVDIFPKNKIALLMDFEQTLTPDDAMLALKQRARDIRSKEQREMTLKEISAVGKDLKIFDGIDELVQRLRRKLSDDEECQRYGIGLYFAVQSNCPSHLVEGTSLGQHLQGVLAPEWFDLGEFFGFGGPSLVLRSPVRVEIRRGIYILNVNPEDNFTERLAREIKESRRSKKIFIGEGQVPDFSRCSSLASEIEETVDEMAAWVMQRNWQ
ncbi:MAG: hypothetical protein KKD17_06605 [Nanoarchaeota archaeon]|nr:hypothetical protein [Nanoarchaeota archaeon]